MSIQEDANLALVRQFYRLIAEGDRDGAYADVFAEDCRLVESAVLPYGGTYHGRERVKQVLAGVMAGFDSFTCEIRNMLAGADEVVVHLHMAGVGRRSRVPFSVTVLELWRFRGGRAIELRPFLFDPAEVARALA